LNQTLRRKANICTGDTNAVDPFDPSIEWDSFAQDTFNGLGTHTANCGGADTAPSVLTTIPANTATDVAIDANITINFSENVTASAGWYDITCTSSGTHAALESGGPSAFTLDPDVDFANSETCTVTVLAAQVTDQDSNDPPDAMAVNFSSSFGTTAPMPSPGDVVISEVYGGGGNAGATYTNDFIELYNRTASSISLSGWSVQYASSAGTSWSVTNLSGSIGPGKYYLVQEATGSGGTTPLPAPDATGTIAMSANNGKVALVQNSTALTDSCPAGSHISDFVGYGTANCFEGAGAAPALTNTTAALRLGNGAQDTDNNNADFVSGDPEPRNSADLAPVVSSTTPANGAANVLIGSNIDITFSEAVNVSGAWFGISCGTSGAHTAVASGGPTTFTLNPDADFAPTESCTVTVVAAQVSDQDTDDPLDTMAADYVFSFTTEGPVCEQPFTPIYNIQGSGPDAAITGTVTTQGIVVGDFEGPTSVGIQGFYLQDTTGDGDPVTSDGIFIYTGNNDNNLSAGQVVRVTGFARERFNQTSLNGSNSNTSPVTNIVDCGSTGSVAATDVLMPFPALDYPERFEGMLVRLPQALVISEYFNYERFGEMVLALPLDGETRPFTGTAIDEPGALANARTLANSLRRITLDDGLGFGNPPSLRHPNGDLVALDNLFRGGDTVQNTVGVLGFDFSLYRIQPTGPADYTSVNPRPTAPEEVGGRLQIAAMNTLNFFLTLDGIDDDSGPDNPADNICGGAANLECRGADASQPLEFTRQRDKLLAALDGLDADVIGLNELENTPGVEPLGDPTNGVVAGLNALPGADPYAFIDTGVIGTDAIRVGLIYRPSKVVPVGDFKILDSTVDPRFIDTKSRPALAQTFEEVATGERFTIVVNHLKSKGSACTDLVPPDPDAGDGQGNCNGTRTLAAQALVDWLATDPTGSGDPDFIIMGDLNSYAQEDPIDAVKAGSDDTAATADDYTNLIFQYQGKYAYSYVFDGQSGYLDHALANATLTAQVTGAADWHINSDEPDLVDYDTTFKPPEQEAIYEPNGYRSSDHDPVIIGLDLVPQCNGLNATVYVDLNGKIVGGPLAGQTFNNSLIGTQGDDVIVGTDTSNTIFSLNGNDVVCSLGGSDTIFGGDGSDEISAGAGSDTVFGSSGDDIIEAEDGDDNVFGESGNDTINGGNGKDNLFAGDGQDVLDGGADKDVLEGGLGVDTLAGGSENDTVLGGPGNDALDGGAGTDVCNGGLGTDTDVACEVRILLP
jgi:predicted extracellular nuclease